MRAFSFRLERVLAVRRLQLDIAEAKLKETLARKSYFRQREETLEQQSRQLVDGTARLPMTTGAALRSMNAYLEHLARISILALARSQYTPALPRRPRLFVLNPAHHLRR